MPVLMKGKKPLCPRCGGYIPNNEEPGKYPGALSRWDNSTEICSACGTDEAMKQFMAYDLQQDVATAVHPTKGVRGWMYPPPETVKK